MRTRPVRIPGIQSRFVCFIVGVAIALSGFVCTTRVQAANDRSIETQIAALAGSLGVQQREALSRIPSPERRLLALRSYVRAGAQVSDRWSWSASRIRTYESSNEYRRLLDDVAAVTRAFERQNPGYTLYSNTQVRSLEVQIERWNTNPRVGRTAAKLHADALRALGPHFERVDDHALEQQLERFLLSWQPSPSAPLAAPGLSKHGQSRAIDFQIMRGDRVVAGTEVSTVARQWEASGWSRKLKQAVESAGNRFEGPLRSPNEPWHYEYIGSGGS